MKKSPDAFRTISEVAEWLGVQTHVLRFWESRFAQVKPVKRAGGRRYYRPSDMELLGGIKRLLHDDGMTIRGVQKLLREQGVKHIAAMSQPLSQNADDVAPSEADMVDITPQAPEAESVDEVDTATEDAATTVSEAELSETMEEITDIETETPKQKPEIIRFASAESVPFEADAASEEIEAEVTSESDLVDVPDQLTTAEESSDYAPESEPVVGESEDTSEDDETQFDLFGGGAQAESEAHDDETASASNEEDRPLESIESPEPVSAEPAAIDEIPEPIVDSDGDEDDEDAFVPDTPPSPATVLILRNPSELEGSRDALANIHARLLSLRERMDLQADDPGT